MAGRRLSRRRLKMSEDKVMGGRALKVVCIAVILLAPVYSLLQLASTWSKPAPRVDFLVYKSKYNATDETVTAWIDHNGTRTAYDVRVFVEWGVEWTVDRVGPEEFIKISYKKALSAQDFPYWEEVFMEWKYLDEGNQLVDGDNILFIILTRNDVVY